MLEGTVGTTGGHVCIHAVGNILDELADNLLCVLDKWQRVCSLRSKLTTDFGSKATIDYCAKTNMAIN